MNKVFSIISLVLIFSCNSASNSVVTNEDVINNHFVVKKIGNELLLTFTPQVLEVMHGETRQLNSFIFLVPSDFQKMNSVNDEKFTLQFASKDMVVILKKDEHISHHATSVDFQSVDNELILYNIDYENYKYFLKLTIMNTMYIFFQ